ncbi:MAG TPA: class I SAM-dependent methyltransferase [Anaeromyxobacteraceae bacterium]|jgi:SAM-dependent methyltransferase
MSPALEQLLDRAAARLLPDAAIPALHDLAQALRQRRAEVGEEAWREEAAAARDHPIADRLGQDPLTRRARARPRGYPGDAVALDFMYGGLPSATRQTTTRLGRAIFAWTAGCSAAAVAVRQRRNTLSRAIDETAATVERARVLAVGAGHLREARVARAFAGRSLGALVAVDGDRECLRVVARDLGDRVRTVHAGVGDVAAGRVPLGQFDLVYAADLLERLDDVAARPLVAALLRAVAPGGRLLLASFVDGFLAHEYMQAFMDWRLECRDEAALVGLVASASRSAARQARTWLDPTGCLAWIEVVRPRGLS